MESEKPALRYPVEWGIMVSLAVIKILLHLFTCSNYGLHRDTLLYIAQGEHPGWGYISVPPFTAMISKLSGFLFGDSNFSYAFFPALAGGLSIILIGLIVKELSGRKVAIMLACSAFLLSPAFLRSNMLLQPVSFDQLFWLLSAFLIIKLVSTRDPAYWFWIGITAGVGFLNKYSIVFFFAAFFIAMLITQERKWLRTYFPYMAFGIAFAIAAPNLYWQYRHNWPVVGHMQELHETQLVNVDFGSFLLMQILMHINVIVIWAAGLIFFLFLKEAKHFRVIGLIFVFALIILMVLHGKPYYTLGLYPMLFAGGGLSIENLFKSKFRFAPNFLLLLMIVVIIPVLPFCLPVYPHEKMAGYARGASEFGGKALLTWEDGKTYPLPQDYADMTGWEETAKNVASVYQQLSADEQSKCIIYASSYGQAGAINYYGKKFQLPEAVCFSESFISWAPENIHANKAIFVEEEMVEHSALYRKIELKAQVTDPWARDPGFVFLMSDPIGNADEKWKTLIKERKALYSMKIRRALEKENE